MNIDDGRVLASSGAMLAEGEFQFEDTEALERLRPADSMVAILSRPGWFASEFALVGNARRDADGRGARTMTIEVRRSAEAFDFAIEARVDEPKRGETRAAPFTVRVRAKLSFATMALAGSRVWWRGGAERWSRPVEDQSGPLAQVLTLDHAGGTPYFPGTLDLGPGQRDYTRGPWVRAQVLEHNLRLTPQRELKRRKGFVAGNNDGPDLIFDHLGTAAWQAMLADADDVVLEQAGADIGRVQGVTGRDAGDVGPQMQPIFAVRMRLSRSEEGLRIGFDGTLDDVRQTPTQPPSGPSSTATS